MNTLGYVARQFDVLASPTSEKKSDDKPRLPRVSTWSTKSFLLPPPTVPTTRTTPKRSHSSPSFRPQPQQPLPPDVTMAPSCKPHIDSVIDRIFVIRVFLLVWDHLKSAWSSLVRIVQDRQSVRLIQDSKPLQALKDKTEEVALTVVDSVSSSSSSLSPTPPPQVASVLENVSASRAATPPIPPRKTPFHLPKTLVLDLDETLIHSTSRPIPFETSTGSGILSLGSFGRSNKGAGHMVEVVLGGRSTIYHVYKRPFVDFFLRTVSSWYTLVIFTASMQEYADPVIDWLDAGRGILEHRFFRDSCTQLPNGSYTKDLSLIEADLSRVCLVDNSPISYTVNEANGIPIEGWTHDPSDEALLDLLPVLDSLRFTSDVRRVLGLRSAGVMHRHHDS
ncbi:CTD nuclear envelope phosphatase 1 [Psilocybe cubensis]|uniref:CTD nuclear envelope phosphatase 1 n=2 Tax=Psilocybe cubensis TaxID=181762 RepID=A0ACB8H4Z3_PSICU|nr:CTD nuclear envelope phosphatase 1 [Psilocybe cubensis]KAH9483063.1 CTD nuclear envelope phosphatase 1 [Psilocybe cubensis]